MSIIILIYANYLIKSIKNKNDYKIDNLGLIKLDSFFNYKNENNNE